MSRLIRLCGGIAVAVLSIASSAAIAQSGSGGDGFATDRVAKTAPAAATILPPVYLSLDPPSLPDTTANYTLNELIRLGLEQNPRLAQAALTIDAARGRALQAGLYPNPTISLIGDELGDRQGPAGINTVPQISQEIVTGRKLTLSRAVAERDIDQATLALATRRIELLAGIRAAYFDVLTIEQRVTILKELRALTLQSVEQIKELKRAKRATDLDIAQLEIEAEKVRADADAAEKELPAAFRRLAVAVGVRDLPYARLPGSLEQTLPDYELDRVRKYVLGVHPEVRSAQVAVERAKLVWQRAQAEPIPNVTISGGYVRQNQNKSNDFMIGVSLPVPVWNRNQGNIQAAQVEVGIAAREVQRVENDLTDRVAAAHRDFAAARERAKRLDEVRKKAQQAFALVSEDKDFTVTPLQRLAVQQAVTQARLEYIRSLGEAWRAASTLSGLTLEEQWPLSSPPPDEKGKPPGKDTPAKDGREP